MKRLALIVLLLIAAGCDVGDSAGENHYCEVTSDGIACQWQNETAAPWTPEPMFVRLENDYTGAQSEAEARSYDLLRHYIDDLADGIEAMRHWG